MDRVERHKGHDSQVKPLNTRLLKKAAKEAEDVDHFIALLLAYRDAQT